MGIHTKKAVDEAHGEEKGADDRRDDFMLDIDLKRAHVQLSRAGVRILGGVEEADCHIGRRALLLLCGCWAGWESALFNERGELRRPACGVQGGTRLPNGAPNCFLLCTCDREESAVSVPGNARSKKWKKKRKADRCHSIGQCFEYIGFMFRNIAFIPFEKMLRGCDFFRMGKALVQETEDPL